MSIKLYNQGYGLLEFAGMLSVLGILILGGIGLTTFMQQGIRIGNLMKYVEDPVVKAFSIDPNVGLVERTQALNDYVNDVADRIEADLRQTDEAGHIVDSSRYRIDVQYRIVDINYQTGVPGGTTLPFTINRGSLSAPDLEVRFNLDAVISDYISPSNGPYIFAVTTGDYISDPNTPNHNYVSQSVIVGVRIFYRVTGGLTAWITGFLNRDSIISKMKIFALRGQLE